MFYVSNETSTRNCTLDPAQASFLKLTLTTDGNRQAEAACWNKVGGRQWEEREQANGCIAESDGIHRDADRLVFLTPSCLTACRKPFDCGAASYNTDGMMIWLIGNHRSVH